MVERYKVLLGFIDEPITDNYKNTVDYATNKLGGFPDWMNEHKPRKIMCKVCGSVTPLLLQIYAPISEKSNYHRTLYIFACLNPSCWANSQSWTCIKNQTQMKETPLADTFCSNFSNEDWFPDANNWDFDQNNQTSSQNMFLEDEATSMMSRVTVCAEENANVISDESCIDVKNVLPSAEIEPDENEPITLDSPILPCCDLINLLKEAPTSPKIYREEVNFIPSFIYVMEEKLEKDPLSEHVQILLMEYSRTSENKNALKVTNNVNVSQQSDEKYEKSNPLHGDKLFHTFLSRIKVNPDQIVRYCRNDRAPLFLYPEVDIPSKCKHCNGEMIFEMQILPTIINYLRLTSKSRTEYDCLEFGSVFVYTCKESCDKSDEESVIVQLEKF